MAVRKVLTVSRNEKLLRTKSDPVKKLSQSIVELIQDIRDTIAENPAVGLAAPQIGALKQVIGVRLAYREDQPEEDMQAPIILINPEIVSEEAEEERGFDACLSIPSIMGYTNRKLKLRVRYRDEQFEPVERDFEGWDARVIQHEIDHLNGVLFTDRLATLDDLFVYVEDDEGKRRQVPYPEIMRRAASGTLNIKPPVIPTLPAPK
jgi:peptide deformylase